MSFKAVDGEGGRKHVWKGGRAGMDPTYSECGNGFGVIGERQGEEGGPSFMRK